LKTMKRKRRLNRMAKRSGRHLSKKWLPIGAVRVMGSDGKNRVWKWMDKEFKTMRELIYRVNPTQKEAEEKEAKKGFLPTGSTALTAEV
jgi:hypothetical protein